MDNRTMRVSNYVDLQGQIVTLSDRRLENIRAVLCSVGKNDSVEHIISAIKDRNYITIIPEVSVKIVIDTDVDFDLTSPGLYIGHIEDEIQPTFIINEYRIVHAALSRNPQIISSIEDFDKEIKSALSIIINRGIERVLQMQPWGSESERKENVHDSGVNISLKRSYNHVKSVVESHQLDIANVRSYLFQKTTSLNMELQGISRFMAIGLELHKIMKSKHAELQTIDLCRRVTLIEEARDMISKVDSYSSSLDLILYRIPQIRDELIKLMNCMKVIHVMDTVNTHMKLYDANEKTILLDVWAYMHTPQHAHNLDNLLEMFVNEMSRLAVLGAEKTDGVECSSGRVSALFSIFETFDSMINIDCVASLRVQVIQNAAPVIYNQFLCERKLEELNECSLMEFKEYLLQKIEDEYSSRLPSIYIHKYVDEVMQVFV